MNCSEKELDPNDAQAHYIKAKGSFDDGYHEVALTQLGEFKSRFPYSRYAIEAELLLAHTQFELGKYEEASLAYEEFTKLHPKHPQNPYVMYRVGECSWVDAPTSGDREQQLTKDAITAWEKLIKAHTHSEWSVKAKEKIIQGHKRLAETELNIVKFYCKKSLWAPCAYRSLLLYKTYSQNNEVANEARVLSIKSLKNLLENQAEQREHLLLLKKSEDELKNLIQALEENAPEKIKSLL